MVVKYNIRDEASAFIMKLVTIDPRERLAANETLLETWLKSWSAWRCGEWDIGQPGHMICAMNFTI